MQRSYLSGPTGGGECQQYFTIYLRAPSYSAWAKDTHLPSP